MTSPTCSRVRRKLGAFVDGELPGAERLAVSQHLSTCASCADLIGAFTNVGAMLREAAADPFLQTADLGGLAGGVVSRIRAEKSVSLKAALSEAVQDWHWALAVGGSIAATFVSAMLVSGLISFGPKPERDDSLAAILNNLGNPAGTLFVVATPVGQDRDSMVMQFDNGQSSSRGDRAPLAARYGTPTDTELVQALDGLVTREGRLVDARAMSAEDRRTAGLLLDEISRRLWSFEPARESAGLVVHRIELVTNTSVTAKAL